MASKKKVCVVGSGNWFVYHLIFSSIISLIFEISGSYTVRICSLLHVTRISLGTGTKSMPIYQSIFYKKLYMLLIVFVSSVLIFI